jgi:uncharacterized cupin superfamily protein
VNELKASLNLAGSLDTTIGGFDLSPEISASEMEVSSIPATWLLSGQGQTRSRLLGKTSDKLAYAMLWECGAACFKWHYAKDEFFIILSGDAFMAEKNGRERHFGPSDVAFFPAGSDVTWRVPNHVRKIAILKSSFSQPIAFLLKAWIKLVELAGLSRDSGL